MIDPSKTTSTETLPHIPLKKSVSILHLDWKYWLGFLVALITLAATYLTLLPENRRMEVLGIATPLSCIPATDQEIGVVIALFDGDFGADQQINVAETIKDAANRVATVRVCELQHLIVDRDHARQTGHAYNASMVVYGRRTGEFMVTSVEVLGDEYGLMTELDRDFRTTLATVKNFEFVVGGFRDLRYVFQFTLAQLLVINGQPELAIDAVDFARASLDEERADELAGHALYVLRANLEFSNGGGQFETLPYLEKAIELDPRQSAAYYVRAHTWIDLHSAPNGDVSNQDIHRSFLNAYRFGADSAEGFYSFLPTEIEIVESLLEDLEAETVSSPDDETIYWSIAGLYLKMGQYQNAYSQYNLYLAEGGTVNEFFERQLTIFGFMTPNP